LAKKKAKMANKWQKSQKLAKNGQKVPTFFITGYPRISADGCGRIWPKIAADTNGYGYESRGYIRIRIWIFGSVESRGVVLGFLKSETENREFIFKIRDRDPRTENTQNPEKSEKSETPYKVKIRENL
jgi:hypothetical protein